jgi:hypothetical protein
LFPLSPLRDPPGTPVAEDEIEVLVQVSQLVQPKGRGKGGGEKEVREREEEGGRSEATNSSSIRTNKMTKHPNTHPYPTPHAS